MSVSRRAVLPTLFLLAILPAVPALAEQRVLVLDPAASKVSFTLGATGHDVHGALAVKSGRIAFDPATGTASGEIAPAHATVESTLVKFRTPWISCGAWRSAAARAQHENSKKAVRRSPRNRLCIRIPTL